MKHSILTVGTLCLLAVASCTDTGKTIESTASEPFDIAFNTWLGYSGVVIADEIGLLEKNNLSVNFTFLEGIGEKNSALIRGDVDAVGHTADSVITSAAAGVEGQIIYVFDQSYGADGILADKSIKTIADLKGRKVAVEPGFTGHFFLLSLLQDVGLKGSDVEQVAMDTGSAGSAFVAGKIDAAVTWEPWIGNSKEREDAHILVTTADAPGRVIDVLYMTNKTIDERHDDVVKLQNSISEATQWYFKNPDKGNKIMADFWKLSEAEVEETVAGIKFLDGNGNKPFFGSTENPGSLVKTLSDANNLWLANGITEKRIQDESSLVFHASKSTSTSK